MTPEEQYKICHALWEKGVSVQVTFEHKSSLPFHGMQPSITVDLIENPGECCYRYDLNNPENVKKLIHKYKLVI